ncbi:hypothetical protein JNW90_01035 [Micromonospora sp. STR1s_5]|nr:hypothetical protein [Micromonospora sp. STR1s_5]
MNDHEKPRFEAMLHDLEVVDDWAERLDPDTPKPPIGQRSPLAADDRKLDPYQLSHASWWALSHAVDHLHMHRNVLRDAAVIHRQSHYTLLRGAFENASAAVWMLAPPSRAERVCRRLRFAALDIRNGDRVRALVGVPAPRTAVERLNQLKDIAQRAGVDEKRAIERVSFLEIVKAAGEHTAIGERRAQMIWNMCSGSAHGDFWAMASMVERIDLPGAPDGIVQSRVTANIDLMAHLTGYAVAMTKYGWAYYDKRATEHFA